MIYTARSHAKVNLFLNIVGKDSKGYHNLQSYFVLLNLSDMITVNTSDHATFCSFENSEQIGNNIVIKAIEYINAVNNSLKFAKIHIKKKHSNSCRFRRWIIKCCDDIKFIAKIMEFARIDL